MQAILQYLQQCGYGTVDGSFYRHIDGWFQWYRGKVARFHAYRQYNGMRQVRRERKTLGMAKQISQDWAALTLNEKVEIVIDDEKIQEQVQRVLTDNNFRVRGNQLAELTFALGTGAFVEYRDSDSVKIDYIRAGMIYPLSWDNGRVLECAFASERIRGKEKLVYLNIHMRQNGRYVIQNKMFVRNGNQLTPTVLPEGVLEEVHTGSSVPLFQILTPNLVNNLMPDCPMGISVYANAIDQMEGVDLVYDSYLNEFRLGKKRMVIPITMAKMQMQEDGTTRPVFDENDVEFFAFDPGKDGSQKFEDMGGTLRYEAHEAGIKTALGLLSAKCGLGNDRYSFEHGQVTAKTATEIISEKSEMFQNLKKHELLLERAVCDLCRAIAALLGYDREFTVNVNFDDSIIEDRAAEQQRDMQQVRDHVMTVWEYRQKYFGESEEQAKQMADELSGAAESDPFGFSRGDG